MPPVLLAREIKGGALQYISYNINNLQQNNKSYYCSLRFVAIGDPGLGSVQNPRISI